MNRKLAAVTTLVFAVAAMALPGCVVSESSKYGPVEKIDQQKVVANHVDLAFRYISRNNRGQARSHLAKALEVDSRSSGAYTAYAMIYDQEGENKLAEESFRAAIKYDSSDMRARFYYGLYLTERDRYQDARVQFTAVTDDVNYSNRALAFVSLGRVELKLGDSAAARQAFDRSLRLNPNSAVVYLELADLDYLAGSYQTASNLLAQYNRLARPSPRSLWLGVRLEHRVNNKDGEASYGLALKNLFPDSAENQAYQEWLKRL